MNLREPTKDNPIKMGKLTVETDGFIWKQRRYSFNDILHIYFLWEQGYAKFVGAPKKHKMKAGADMYIELELVNTKQNISTKSFTWFSHESGKQSDFYTGYIFLANKTFVNRYNHYVEEIKNKGYFTYLNIRFYKDGKFVTDKYENNIFNHRIYKKPFELYLESKDKPKGLWNKLKAKYTSIPTQCDQDVFYALMKQVYGISWK